MPRRRFHAIAVGVALTATTAMTACSHDNGVEALQSSGASASSANTPTTGTPSAGTNSTSPSGTDVEAPKITWTGVQGAVQEGTIDVPIDYTNPAAGSFTLKIAWHRATDQSHKVGSLLVNPGGPGAAGISLAEQADNVYDDQLLQAFDIVAWDPRGTGESTPAVDCVDDYDTYFAIDSSPDTPAEQQDILDAATDFGAKCEQHSGKILPFVSTADSARDMDTIRRALGEDTISYFGFSYGSELGVTWASMFPETVRAMVIDGAADQSVGYIEQNLEQAAGFEAAFDDFLADCSARANCAFHNNGDAAGAYDKLNAAVDASPIPSRSGRPDVTQGVLATAVADSMYSKSGWDPLATALDDLQHGKGAAILDLYDDYYGRQTDGTYNNEYEAYFAINCLDDPGSKDPQAVFALQDQFAKVAPRLGPSWIAELEFCAEWPVPAAPPVAINANGAGPVVVVGTTGDPATPLDSTRHMAAALEDGRLIVVTANQHTGYGVNACVDDAVDASLIDLRPPVGELICDK